jgi:hypothetical protein
MKSRKGWNRGVRRVDAERLREKECEKDVKVGGKD